MPRKALRAVVELYVKCVSAPGVWLPHRDEIYLTINLFNQHRQTLLSGPTFPLYFDQVFKFDKIFYTAFEPSQVEEFLHDEVVTIEMVQLSGIGDGRLLAFHESSAKDFLYPYPRYSPDYDPSDLRYRLMERTLDFENKFFQGIAPKLEFSTKTTIVETNTAALNLYDDLNTVNTNSRSPYYRSPRSPRSHTPTKRTHTHKKKSSSAGRRQRTRHRWGYRRPTISSISRCSTSISSPRRSRPSSPSRLMQSLSFADDPVVYSDEEDVKPPFVVRKVNKNLIGRVPGSGEGGVRRSRSKRRAASPSHGYSPRCRSLSPTPRSTGRYRYFYDDDLLYDKYRNSAYPRTLIRDPADDLHICRARHSKDLDYDLDAEDLGYNSLRDRSNDVSAFDYELDRSHREKALRSYSPSSLRFRDTSPSLARRVRSRLERYDPVLDDLELDLALARSRRY